MPKQTQSTATDQPATSNQLPADTLIPTEKIIALARARNVDFGPGDANERIRYFIKLGILPHQKRKAHRSSGNQALGQSGKTQPDNPITQSPDNPIATSSDTGSVYYRTLYIK